MLSAARDGAPDTPAKAAVASRMQVKDFIVSLLSEFAMPNGLEDESLPHRLVFHIIAYHQETRDDTCRIDATYCLRAGRAGSNGHCHTRRRRQRLSHGGTIGVCVRLPEGQRRNSPAHLSLLLLHPPHTVPAPLSSLSPPPSP